MKNSAVRAAIIFLEVSAILVAVLAATATLFVIRLQQGPVQLTAFQGSVEFAIESRLPVGYGVEIREIDVVQKGKAVALSLRDLTITDESGATVVEGERVDLAFRTGDLLSGSVGPREVDAVGARFNIVRNRDQTLKIPAARGRGGKSLFPTTENFVNQRILKSAFENAEMRDAHVTFFDEASGRSWTSDDATILLNRTSAGLTAELSGGVSLEEKRASIGAVARYVEADGIIALQIDGADFPVGDLFTTFFGNAANILDAPVSGTASIELTKDGDVMRSSFDARIGAGDMVLAGARLPIKFVEWTTGFNPNQNQFTIDSFRYDVAGNSGSATGAVALTLGDEVRDLRAVSFDVDGRDLIVALPGHLPEPLSVPTAATSGRYEIETRTLDLDALLLEFLDVSASGSFSFHSPRPEGGAPPLSPAIAAALNVEGSLDPDRLLRVWPMGVAMGARDWIDERLETADVTDIKARVNLPAGGIRDDGFIPDEAIEVTFSVSNGKAFYVTDMTPLTNASGRGVLRGNSFLLSADTGRVGDVLISQGEVDIPIFIPKWQETFYRFKAAGSAEDMLGILNEDPLNLLSKVNLDPDQFKGRASADIEIMRPNKRNVDQEDYRYSGDAAFSEMVITGLTGDADIVGAEGTVELKPRSLTVNAGGDLAEAPIDIVWKKNFYAQDGPSKLMFSGVLDASVGDVFGFSLRRFVRGPVAATATAIGNLGEFQSLDIAADFTNAALSLELLDWQKPFGVPATGEIQIRFDGPELMIDKVELAGDGLSIKGAIGFREGIIDAAAFPEFYLGDAANFSLTASRDAMGLLDLTLTGSTLNAGPAILEFTKGERAQRTDNDDDGSFWGAGVAVTARLDQLDLRKDVTYRDASLDLRRDATALRALDFSALNQNGEPLKVTLSRLGNETGPTQLVEARSTNLGYFLRGVTGFSSLRGGEGVMAIRFGGEDVAGLAGEIEARGMHMENAPLLARIFSSGSLDGLSNLMQGEGIDLSYAYGNFALNNGMLTLTDFRATGPSVGLTASGDVSLKPEGSVALSGAIAPLYQLNSVLGAAPIIGDILVGREGEGIVALSYSVTGDRAAPDVFVNPLSALTPGVFRQLFESDRPRLVAPEDAETESVTQPE